ncbi:CopG family transcriptional regulator [Bordetella petrii]|nr:CopG family transcriptional regulator [Bordetella petrii]
MSTRTRLNLFIEPSHARRLEDISAYRGVSKSSLVAAALASFLSPDAADQREAALARRLDRISRQLDKLDRDQNILIETLAIYVRVFLTVSPPVPSTHQEAARAQGKLRYGQFIDQLARHLQRGRSLVREVHEEIRPDAYGLTAGGDDGPAVVDAESPVVQNADEANDE